MTTISLQDFKQKMPSLPSEGKLIDVRTPLEHRSTSIPLYELRERIQEIPTDKPVLVHCAGGYRSAVAVSILRSQNIESFDLSTAIQNYS